MAAPASALFTYADVATHNTKKDLYVVIHDNVYNASSFVDEHPCVFFPPFLVFSSQPMGKPGPLLVAWE